MSIAKTVAESIERTLAIEILQGKRVPGAQLPPVRALAEEYGVTPPTIQRVVERLAIQGLVTARRGSGVTVNDPEGSGSLSLLPLWLEAPAAPSPEGWRSAPYRFGSASRAATAAAWAVSPSARAMAWAAEVTPLSNSPTAKMLVTLTKSRTCNGEAKRAVP